MVVRLIAFLGTGAYLASMGALALAALSLLGLLPGLLGLVGAVVFAVALVVTGHWVLAILILVVVAVVFWLSNPQWHRSRQTSPPSTAPLTTDEAMARAQARFDAAIAALVRKETWWRERRARKAAFALEKAEFEAWKARENWQGDDWEAWKAWKHSVIDAKVAARRQR